MTRNLYRPTRKPRIMSLRLAVAAHRLRGMTAIGGEISPSEVHRRCTRGGTSKSVGALLTLFY